MIPTSVRNYYLSVYVVIGLAVISIAAVDADLKLVTVLFRHGDRTPDNNGYEMYPNDPYLNYDFYPMGLGQLTNQGKKREYQLGKVLKDRYAEFLGQIYIPKDVAALSSDYDRTKMSLQLVLAGLYPPMKIQKWNSELDWQPIPMNYLKRITDNIFLPDECPLFLAEYNKAVNSVEGQKQLSKFKEMIDQLTIWTGKNMTTPLDLFYLYHTLMAEQSLNLPLPEWAYTVFPNGELWDATVFAYDIANSTPLLRRLYGGPYIKTVTDIMVASKNGSLKDPKKIYLYSGHETNVASVLKAFKVFTPHVPEYSSAVIMELHKSKHTYFVKVLYYLGIPPVVTELRLPGCEVLCPLDKFLQLTSDVIPSDEEMFCDKSILQEFANYRSPIDNAELTYNLIRTGKSFRSQ